MAARKNLHIVGADVPAPVVPAVKKTVTQAAADGDRLELLVAMRERIARAVDHADTPARDLAALARKLLEIAKEIDVLMAARKQEDSADASREDQAFDASAI